MSSIADMGPLSPYLENPWVQSLGIFALSLVVTVITFVLTLFLLAEFDTKESRIQPITETIDAKSGKMVETSGVTREWIGNWNIYYKLGYDGTATCVSPRR